MNTKMPVGEPQLLPGYSTLPDATRAMTLALCERLRGREYDARGVVVIAIGTRDVGEPGKLGLSAESGQLGDGAVAAFDDALLCFAIDSLMRELARRTQPRVIEAGAPGAALTAQPGERLH